MIDADVPDGLDVSISRLRILVMLKTVAQLSDCEGFIIQGKKGKKAVVLTGYIPVCDFDFILNYATCLSQ
jgi:hypothetical protein